MIRLLSAIALLMPGAAVALSCLPHSIEATYLEAEKSAASYLVVRGALKFDSGKLPTPDFENQAATPDLTRIEAVFEGQMFDGKRFSTPFEQDVILEVACYGPWCAKPPSGTDVLAFVRKDAGGYTVSTNPCGGFLFDNPQRKDIKALKSCHAGSACVPKRR